MDINWKVSDMMREIQEKFGIIVSRNVCYKARAAARRTLQGTLTEHYHLLPAYVAELRNVSRGTFKMEVGDWTENSATFKRSAQYFLNFMMTYALVYELWLQKTSWCLEDALLCMQENIISKSQCWQTDSWSI